MRRRCWPLVAVVAFVSGGCADLGDDPGSPAGPMEPPPGPTVSFATDIQPVFDASCVGCHGAGGNAGLDLRPGQSHGNLVGVAATESTLNRIEPGQPEQSWLYLKITAQQDVGDPMPPSGGLPQATSDLVRTWIEEGAEDN
jgi:hypothetical protein